MRPRITCHMITSLDGRLLPSRWGDPDDYRIDDLIEMHYEAVSERLGGEGWIVGRRTMKSDVAGERSKAPLGEPRPRPSNNARRDGRAVAVVIDPRGSLTYDADHVEGDHIVSVLSERVEDDYTAYLRNIGISYVFAGSDGRNMQSAMECLGEEFGIRQLILEGGGITNGAFLAEGLIDEISTLICPTIDGLTGIPAIFDYQGPPASLPAAGQKLGLLSCETLEGGVVWLHHQVRRN